MKLAVIAAVILLTGCAQAVQFTEGDVSNAGVIATKAGDAQAATCWTTLSGALMPSPNPADDGLAVAVERQRLLQGVATGPCAPVILPILLQLLSLGLHIPLGGL